MREIGIILAFSNASTSLFKNPAVLGPLSRGSRDSSGEIDAGAVNVEDHHKPGIIYRAAPKIAAFDRAAFLLLFFLIFSC